jgi:CRISPR/Cas system CSM-associated protein Csm3 (group 7 of RAMP superfamily)
MTARWQDQRGLGLVKRIVVTGQLELMTPARFGNGDAEELTDMPLARDPKENKALLTGASIAGALRNYAREWLYGYEQDDKRARLVHGLFGTVRDEGKEKSSEESWLIVDDALAVNEGVELRNGVAIEPMTRTAKPGALYDYELLEAGTRFPLRFELTVTAQNEDELRRTLAVALTGFEHGEIGLGARKRRGLGECRVTEWQVEVYDFTTRRGLVDWIAGRPGEVQPGQKIAEKLSVPQLPDDKRQRFTLDALFHLESSLLIRSGSGRADSPDMVHLHSKREGESVPIVSGTSLAGAIRARAQRIANTVMALDDPQRLIEEMFGPRFNGEHDRSKNKRASRVGVAESIITEPIERVQSRVKIDRFTGGTYPGALFDQQPVFGGRHTQLRVKIELRKPDDKEIGLLLQVLKDLWTGDLPLGGEASVGRGRLHGLRADLRYQNQAWTLREADGKLTIEGDRAALEKFAAALGGGQ